tara:strand:- start:456 stop:902 length:447 start_codon:yes stop_codon:yes gene_type:complete
MRRYPANYVHDFIQSPYFELAPNHLKSHAESILQYLFDGLDTDSLDQLKETLIERIRTSRSRILLPESTYESISEIVECYFSYLDSSGNIPGASDWSIWINGLPPFDSISEDHGSMTVRHNFKKTGRNDPCPCGSGSKFKKCCIKLLK